MQNLSEIPYSELSNHECYELRKEGEEPRTETLSFT